MAKVVVMSLLTVVMAIHAAAAVEHQGNQPVGRVDEWSHGKIAAPHSTRKPDPVARYDAIASSQIQTGRQETPLKRADGKVVVRSDPFVMASPAEQTPLRYAESSWRRDVEYIPKTVVAQTMIPPYVVSAYVDRPIVTYRVGIHYDDVPYYRHHRRHHLRRYCDFRSHYGQRYYSHFGVGLHFRF